MNAFALLEDQGWTHDVFAQALRAMQALVDGRAATPDELATCATLLAALGKLTESPFLPVLLQHINHCTPYPLRGLYDVVLSSDQSLERVVAILSSIEPDLSSVLVTFIDASRREGIVAPRTITRAAAALMVIGSDVGLDYLWRNVDVMRAIDPSHWSRVSRRLITSLARVWNSLRWSDRVAALRQLKLADLIDDDVRDILLTDHQSRSAEEAAHVAHAFAIADDDRKIPLVLRGLHPAIELLRDEQTPERLDVALDIMRFLRSVSVAVMKRDIDFINECKSRIYSQVRVAR